MNDEKAGMKLKQIPELTGLRGLAALLIVVNHMVLLVPMLKRMGFSHGTWLCGVSGMSLFFVLSGIVIYYNYASMLAERPGEGVRRFFVARFARLYPLYIVFILGFFIWNARHDPGSLPQNITSLPVFLAGMQSWIYGYIDGTELIYLQGSANISWSISTEFALYFLFVPLAIFLGKASVRKAFIILFSAIVLQCVYVYCICNVPCLTSWADSVFPGHTGAVGVYLTYHSPLGRAFEFVSGCAIGMFFICKNKSALAGMRSFTSFSAVSWALALLCGILAMLKTFPNWTPVLVSTGLILFCSGLPYFGARVFRWRVLLFLGEVSYSAYLLHIIFVIALRYDGCEKWAIAKTICSFLVTTYFFAWMSFKWFESPARRYIRGLANRH